MGNGLHRVSIPDDPIRFGINKYHDVLCARNSPLELGTIDLTPLTAHGWDAPSACASPVQPLRFNLLSSTMPDTSSTDPAGARRPDSSRTTDHSETTGPSPSSTQDARPAHSRGGAFQTRGRETPATNARSVREQSQPPASAADSPLADSPLIAPERERLLARRVAALETLMRKLCRTTRMDDVLRFASGLAQGERAGSEESLAAESLIGSYVHSFQHFYDTDYLFYFRFPEPSIAERFIDWTTLEDVLPLESVDFYDRATGRPRLFASLSERFPLVPSPERVREVEAASPGDGRLALYPALRAEELAGHLTYCAGQAGWRAAPAYAGPKSPLMGVELWIGSTSRVGACESEISALGSFDFALLAAAEQFGIGRGLSGRSRMLVDAEPLSTLAERAAEHLVRARLAFRHPVRHPPVTPV